ncbi:MAG: hypothetical protein ACMG6E_00265 [Candidatus Roizmanbacteria bacterium]
MNTKTLVIGVLVIALLGLGFWKFNSLSSMKNEQSMTSNQVKDQPDTTTPTGIDTQMKKTYKNGTYKAKGDYKSPAGAEDIDVSLTLKNGVISAATFVGNGTNPTTKLMQGKFAAGFEKEVVGKSIDELDLQVVNGSSLTPKGFMDAVQKIQTQAQS